MRGTSSQMNQAVGHEEVKVAAQYHCHLRAQQDKQCAAASLTLDVRSRCTML